MDNIRIFKTGNEFIIEFYPDDQLFTKEEGMIDTIIDYFNEKCNDMDDEYRAYLATYKHFRNIVSRHDVDVDEYIESFGGERIR